MWDLEKWFYYSNKLLLYQKEGEAVAELKRFNAYPKSI